MTKRGRVLIVDDDSMIVDILCQILCKEYDVETTATGNACLAQLVVFRPQVVLLDIVMPGISGHETCRRIKFSPLGDSVRVILVSAEDTIVDWARGSDVLADDYLIKPFDYGEMLARVQAQFDALNRGTSLESMRDVKLGHSGIPMNELQRTRLAAALRRLEDIAGIHRP